VKAALLFGVAVAVLVCGLGFLLAIPFNAPADRTAIEASAGVAFVVQLFAFAIARLAAKSSYLAGWVIGVALRFAALIVFAFVAVKGMALPAPAALISLATFLFSSTLVESKFLTL
jgi:hypothetical protein